MENRVILPVNSSVREIDKLRCMFVGKPALTVLQFVEAGLPNDPVMDQSEPVMDFNHANEMPSPIT